MEDGPDYDRIAERLAHALRQTYGRRLREVSWSVTPPALILHAELLGPVDSLAERARMARALYDIAVAEGVTVVCVPVEAGSDHG